MLADSEIVRQIKINESTVSLRADGIVQVLFHKNITLDLALQMLLLRIFNEITEKKKHPFLYEALEGVKVTKEARDNAISIESKGPGNAYALVAVSPAYRLMANFYVKIKPTLNPYKIFSKREEAIEWLKQFRADFNQH
jgi:hypothetical protein